MSNIFHTKVEFLKGVGPQKAAILAKELKIFTFGELLQHYPFRYDDRTKIHSINNIIPDTSHVLIKGKFSQFELIGDKRRQRLVSYFSDGTGEIEVVWFQGVTWIKNNIKPLTEYLLFGKPTLFGSRLTVTHPEIDIYISEQENTGLTPVYHTTELMKRKYLDSRALSKLTKQLVEQIKSQIPETLSPEILQRYSFVDKATAITSIHYPSDEKSLQKARARLKFEELFYIQLKLFREKGIRKNTFAGMIFKNIPLLNDFYNNHLPFELTEAQKRVIREIRKDFLSGQQMNRLLQGDVGSGKTIVAFICMLMALDNDAQACLMAPTEILSEQHYQGLIEYADKLEIKIELLTGSTKKKERTRIHASLLSGETHILIGTHALLEDIVQFKNLGLCVIDEQHRFGVAQRARLWRKNTNVYPHILVMTATPIPRTLAMTVYGDLDTSVIDELPKGRKPIKTIHRFDSSRARIFGFVREEIEKGRQVYFVYPLIEESEKLDLKDLMDGYESISRAFPPPQYQISIVHGRMKAEDKEYEMQRFIKKQTHIMVATTVIEVGVNVPNASMMVIENAERFGLAQLHQLRGRVGRGSEQSYCVLMTGNKLSREARIRMETMEKTTNGFEIADVDLKLRGPGDLQGTQQSGVVDLLIADISKDTAILTEARVVAQEIIQIDPQLELQEHFVIKRHIASLPKNAVNWGRIS